MRQDSPSRTSLNIPTDCAVQSMQDAAMWLKKFEGKRLNAVSAKANYVAAKSEHESILNELKYVEDMYETKDWQEQYNALQATANRIGPKLESAAEKMHECEAHYKEVLKEALDTKATCEKNGISIQWDSAHVTSKAVVTDVEFGTTF